MRFCLGYNQDFEGFVNLLETYSEAVCEVYFPLPRSIGSSGRAEVHTSRYSADIFEIIKLCSKLGFRSALLINASCEGKYIGDINYMYRILNYIKKLEKFGLDSVIVTNPLLIMLLRQEMPNLEIQASVNCYCQTVEHAKYLKELGVSVLTIDRDINRDIDRILNIKKSTGLQIKILLNEGCLLDCPFRKFHFNQMAHINLKIPRQQISFFRFASMACLSLLEKHPEICFKSPFVRPEDLWRYKGIVDYFKIASRTTDTDLLKIRLEAYRTERFDGNLVSLFETFGIPKVIKRIDNKRLDKFHFFDQISSCNKNCNDCNYCKDLFKETAILWDHNIPYSSRKFPSIFEFSK
jgi:collagenase-like PrtC family protease